MATPETIIGTRPEAPPSRVHAGHLTPGIIVKGTTCNCLFHPSNLTLIQQTHHGSSPPSASSWRSRRPLSFKNPQTNGSPSILLLRRRDRSDRLYHICRWPTPRCKRNTGLARAQRRCHHWLDSGFVLVVREPHHVCFPFAFQLQVRSC